MLQYIASFCHCPFCPSFPVSLIQSMRCDIAIEFALASSEKVRRVYLYPPISSNVVGPLVGEPVLRTSFTIRVVP